MRLLLLVIVGAAIGPAAGAEPPLDQQRYTLTAPDGRVSASATPSPTVKGRYDLRSPRGERLATVTRAEGATDPLRVRGADGRSLGVLRRNPLVAERYDEFNSRGQRTGYWQRSKLTGRWDHYTPDGERVSIAIPRPEETP